MPEAAGCFKGMKIPGQSSLVTALSEQRTTAQKIPRACLSVPVNMKIQCALPTAK